MPCARRLTVPRWAACAVAASALGGVSQPLDVCGQGNVVLGGLPDAAELDGYLRRASKVVSPAGNTVVLVEPHAGFAYSGPVAATGYESVRRWAAPSHAQRCDTGGCVDLVVALGFWHNGPPKGAGQTVALGDSICDSNLVNAGAASFLQTQLKSANVSVSRGKYMGGGEHSLEQQVVFLSKIFGQRLRGRLLPVMVNAGDSPLKFTRDVASSLQALIASRPKSSKVLVVASSDLSHFFPKSEEQKIDGSTISLITKADPSNLLWRFMDLRKQDQGDPSHAYKQSFPCGSAPILVAAHLAQLMGLSGQRLALGSGGSDGSVVGYTSVLFSGATARSSPPPTPPAPAAAAPPPPPRLSTLSVASSTGTGIGSEDLDHLLRAAAGAVAAKVGAPGGSEKNLGAIDGLERGIFVTLTKRGATGNDLRGCIGCISPPCGGGHGLLDYARHYAELAAVADSRFSPVKAPELPGLDIEVSVLSAPQPVERESIKDGDGVVLHAPGGKTGVFLPQVWDTFRAEGLEGDSLKTAFLSDLAVEKAGYHGELAAQGVTFENFHVDKRKAPLAGSIPKPPGPPVTYSFNPHQVQVAALNQMGGA